MYDDRDRLSRQEIEQIWKQADEIEYKIKDVFEQECMEYAEVIVNDYYDEYGNNPSDYNDIVMENVDGCKYLIYNKYHGQILNALYDDIDEVISSSDDNTATMALFNEMTELVMYYIEKILKEKENDELNSDDYDDYSDEEDY